MDVQELIEDANRAWQTRPVPRPPMTQLAHLQFAYDWPVIRLLSPICCLCRFRPGRKLEALTGHLDTRHPGLLEEWNTKLREGGVVEHSQPEAP